MFSTFVIAVLAGVIGDFVADLIRKAYNRLFGNKKN